MGGPSVDCDGLKKDWDKALRKWLAFRQRWERELQELKDAQKEVDKARNALKRLEGEAQKLWDDCVTVDQERAKLSEDEAQLRVKNQELSGSLQLKNQALGSANVSLSRSLDEASSRASTLYKAIEAKDRALTRLERAIRAMTTGPVLNPIAEKRYQIAFSDYSAASTQIATLQNEYGPYIAQADAAQATATSLSREISSLKAQIKKNGLVLTSLTKQIAGKQQQERDLVQQAEQKDREAAHLKDDLRRALEHLKYMTERLGSLEEEEKKLRDEFLRLVQEWQNKCQQGG